jgi:hypothetical protein
VNPYFIVKITVIKQSSKKIRKIMIGKKKFSNKRSLKDKGFQKYKVFKTQGSEDTGFQRHRVSKTQGFKDTGFQRHRVFRSTREINYKAIMKKNIITI